MHRILLEIGPFTLYTYGLCVALAFLASSVFILRDSKKFGISTELIFDLLIVILVSGLIGARALFVLINWRYFSEHLLSIFMIHQGGLAFQGALILAVLCAAFFVKLKKLPLWKTADLAAPYIALGQGIGRVGCFLNGCCYGKPVEKGLAVSFPGEAVSRMPVQIYSAVGLFLIFFILKALRTRSGRKSSRGLNPGHFEGFTFSMYLVLYSAFRFFMDFFRDDIGASFLSLSLSQLICVGTFFCGTLLYIKRKVESRE